MSGTATSMSAYHYPTAVSWGHPHLEVFTLGDDVYPQWKYRDSSSSEGWNPGAQSFASLGGQTDSYQPSVAAIARAEAVVDIFPVSYGTQLFHKYHTSTSDWVPNLTTWEHGAGRWVYPPTVAACGADRMDIFIIGFEDRLYQLSKDLEGWSSWGRFEPNNTWTRDAPTVVSWGGNRYDIFLVNATDQALYHLVWDDLGRWPSEWKKIGGYLTSRPVAVSRREGRLDIFARGGDAGLWHISFNQYASGSIWSNWTSISGDTKVQSEPEAVSWNPENIEVFAWGEDNTLLHKRYDDNDKIWAPDVGFEVIGYDLAGPPKAVCDRSEGVHVFAYLDNGQLGHKSWDSDAKAWEPRQDFELLGSVR